MTSQKTAEHIQISATLHKLTLLLYVYSKAIFCDVILTTEAYKNIKQLTDTHNYVAYRPNK